MRLLKNLLIILLSFLLVFSSFLYDKKEVEAFAPAIPVGAGVAAGGAVILGGALSSLGVVYGDDIAEWGQEKLDNFAENSKDLYNTVSNWVIGEDGKPEIVTNPNNLPTNEKQGFMSRLGQFIFDSLGLTSLGLIENSGDTALVTLPNSETSYATNYPMIYNYEVRGTGTSRSVFFNLDDAYALLYESNEGLVALNGTGEMQIRLYSAYGFNYFYAQYSSRTEIGNISKLFSYPINWYAWDNSTLSLTEASGDAFRRDAHAVMDSGYIDHVINFFNLNGIALSIVPINELNDMINLQNLDYANQAALKNDIRITWDVIQAANPTITWDGTNIVDASTGTAVDTGTLNVPTPQTHEKDAVRIPGWWIDDNTFIDTSGNTHTTEGESPPAEGGSGEDYSGFFGSILDYLKDILAAIISIPSNIIDLSNRLVDKIGDIALWINGAVVDLVGQLDLLINLGLDRVIDSIGNIANWLNDAAILVTGSLGINIDRLIDSVGDITAPIINLFNGLNTTVGNISDSIFNVGVDIVAGIGSFINSGVNTLDGHLSNIFTFLSSLSLSNVLTNILSGINNIAVTLNNLADLLLSGLESLLIYLFYPASIFNQLQALYNTLINKFVVVQDIKTFFIAFDNQGICITKSNDEITIMGVTATIFNWSYLHSISSWSKPIMASFIWLIVFRYLYIKISSIIADRHGT